MSTNSEVAKLQKIGEIEAQLIINPKAAASFAFLANYILNCEYELILFMNEQGHWQGPLPPPPVDFKKGKGSIEFGLFLYWFNNSYLLNDPEISFIAAVLNTVLKLPKSQMTVFNYDFLVDSELIYEDGTIISTKTWATYDQGWFTAFINLLQTNLYDLWYNNGTFPMPSKPQPITLSGAVANTVKIAMLGDWGTGDATSAAVMNKVLSQNPDYIIHLGDVYYGGTPTAGNPASKHYYSLGEEQNNLTNVWPAGFVKKSFTLNSNHEMYSGANGLFTDALLASGTPFVSQQGMSCFLLQYAGWSILGLDSAYNATSLDAFMSGSLGGVNGPQVAWIKTLNLDPSKTIVLTHHTGFEYDASSIDQLWIELRYALNGKDPYAWYWGHAHNGIVYSKPVNIGAFTTNTYARCAGHAALPYGVSTNLQHNPNVLWQASTAQPLPSLQVYNGFVMLTMQSVNNQVNRINESFFDIGTAGPTWNVDILK